jgi:hypothetical protein
MSGTCPNCGAKITLHEEGNLTIGRCDCNGAGLRVVINFITPELPPAKVDPKTGKHK